MKVIKSSAMKKVVNYNHLRCYEKRNENSYLVIRFCDGKNRAKNRNIVSNSISQKEKSFGFWKISLQNESIYFAESTSLCSNV